jgi:putative membrane protein
MSPRCRPGFMAVITISADISGSKLLRSSWSGAPEEANAGQRHRKYLIALGATSQRRASGTGAPTSGRCGERNPYANERTFLAWNRTALALIATGVAATQLLPRFRMACRPLLGLPLPRSPMPFILGTGIVAIAVLALVIAALGGPAKAPWPARGSKQTRLSLVSARS